MCILVGGRGVEGSILVKGGRGKYPRGRERGRGIYPNREREVSLCMEGEGSILVERGVREVSLWREGEGSILV